MTFLFRSGSHSKMSYIEQPGILRHVAVNSRLFESIFFPFPEIPCSGSKKRRKNQSSLSTGNISSISTLARGHGHQLYNLP